MARSAGMAKSAHSMNKTEGHKGKSVGKKGSISGKSKGGKKPSDTNPKGIQSKMYGSGRGR